MILLSISSNFYQHTQHVVAGDKATDLDQIGRFVFNFGDPTKGARKATKDTEKQLLVSVVGRGDHDASVRQHDPEPRDVV